MVSSLLNKLPTPVRHWLSILGAAGSNWLASQAFIYAAALAFFTVFSIAPIMVVVVTLVGLVLGERAAQGELFEQLEEAHELVGRNVLTQTVLIRLVQALGRAMRGEAPTGLYTPLAQAAVM